MKHLCAHFATWTKSSPIRGESYFERRREACLTHFPRMQLVTSLIVWCNCQEVIINNWIRFESKSQKMQQSESTA